MNRAAANDWLDRELADFKAVVPPADFRPGAVELAQSAWAVRRSDRPRRCAGHRRVVLMSIAPVVTAAVALWVATRAGGAPSATGRVEPTHGVVESSSSAAATDTPYATVVGPHALLIAGAGPVRRLVGGEPIPVGAAVRPESHVGAALRITNRADVFLDAGAEVVVVVPSPAADALSLLAGRISIRAVAAPRPVRVRIPSGGSELEADAALFGALVAKGGRWAVAVDSGEVRVVSPPSVQRVTAGMEAGGRAGGPALVRPRSTSLALAVESAREGRDWIVRGLSDALARVEISGAEVAVDDAGNFRSASAPTREVCVVVAIDASGRRSEQTVRLPDDKRSMAPSRSAGKPVRPKQQRGASDEDDDVLIHPPSW